MKVTLPTLHLNGTGAASLQREYHAVLKALNNVSDALAQATCHPRDFYPQGDGAWEQARAERDKAFENLREVQEYVEQWLTHIHDSGRV